jgi:hypothetical protein
VIDRPKQLELPPKVTFMEDVRAYYAEPNKHKRDEIAARQTAHPERLPAGPRQAPAASAHRLCVRRRYIIYSDMMNCKYLHTAASRGPRMFPGLRRTLALGSRRVPPSNLSGTVPLTIHVHQGEVSP